MSERKLSDAVCSFFKHGSYLEHQDEVAAVVLRLDNGQEVHVGTIQFLKLTATFKALYPEKYREAQAYIEQHYLRHSEDCDNIEEQSQGEPD